MTDVAPDAVHDVAVADGVRLHTRRWCGGDRVPMVLLHGLASNARLWDGVALRLAGAGHPVVAVDQRGHGRSSKPEVGYDLGAVTDDLRSLLDLLDLERPVLVGQSWGGNVVLELAARFPGRARGIACIDGGTIDLSRRFRSWDDCVAAMRPPALAGAPSTEIEAMLRRSHPDWPEAGIRGTLAGFEHHADGTATPWLDLDRHLQVLRGLWEHHPRARYGAVREPVLLLVADTPDGGDDGSARRAKRRDVEEAAASLPRARVHWMAGDHDLHAQHPERVAGLLHAFAAELAVGP